MTGDATFDEAAALADAAARAGSGDVAGAEAAYRTLLDRDPFSVAGHIGQAHCRARLGDEEGARLLYARALRLAEDRVLPAHAQSLHHEAERALHDIRVRGDRRR